MFSSLVYEGVDGCWKENLPTRDLNHVSASFSIVVLKDISGGIPALLKAAFRFQIVSPSQQHCLWWVSLMILLASGNHSLICGSVEYLEDHSTFPLPILSSWVDSKLGVSVRVFWISLFSTMLPSFPGVRSHHPVSPGSPFSVLIALFLSETFKRLLEVSLLYLIHQWYALSSFFSFYFWG